MTATITEPTKPATDVGQSAHTGADAVHICIRHEGGNTVEGPIGLVLDAHLPKGWTLTDVSTPPSATPVAGRAVGYVSIETVRQEMQDAGVGSRAVEGWPAAVKAAGGVWPSGPAAAEAAPREVVEATALRPRESWFLKVLEELSEAAGVTIEVTYPTLQAEFDKFCTLVERVPGDQVPILETDPEEGTHELVTYGHCDTFAYAEAANAWIAQRQEAAEVGGWIENQPVPITRQDVEHRYAVNLQDGEEFSWADRITEHTPHAFPITLVSLG